MSPKAKALLRALVADHVLRVRRGEAVVRLTPLDVSERYQLGIARENIEAVAEELVQAELCVWADGALALLANALNKTL